jgi:hypothetical protein
MYKNITTQMDGYHDPELCIKQMPANLIIEDLQRQADKQQKLLREFK